MEVLILIGISVICGGHDYPPLHTPTSLNLEEREKQINHSSGDCSCVSRRRRCTRWLIASRWLNRWYFRCLGHIQISTDAAMAVEHESRINSHLDRLETAKNICSVHRFLSRNTLFFALLQCPFYRTRLRPVILTGAKDKRPSMIGLENSGKLGLVGNVICPIQLSIVGSEIKIDNTFNCTKEINIMFISYEPSE